MVEVILIYLKIATVSLATWRASSLLAREEGPFDVLTRLRHCLGVRSDEDSISYGTNCLSKGLLCVWCSSVWFAALGALYTASDPLEWIIHTLAISALAIIVDGITN